MKRFTLLLLTLLSLQVFADTMSYNIHIVEQKSKTPIADAYVRVIDLTAGKTMIAVSNDSGFVALQLNDENRYRVDVSKRNAGEGVRYITFSYFVTGNEILHPTFNEIGLEKVTVNSKVRLSNIYFAENSAELNGMDKVALSNALIALKNSPAMTLEIAVHAACNEAEHIADKRAEVIQDYFSNKGELAQRVHIKSYGKDKPLGGGNCNTPMVNPDSDNSMNRVAEFKVINI